MSFRQNISSGKFTVTCEVAPKKSTHADEILETVREWDGLFDAVNVTDNQRACVRASSLVVSKLLFDNGVEPVLQMTCRDRNRIALQSDLLGAHMLGIRNLLAVTGDHPRLGDHPNAKPVYDFDSTQLIEAVVGLNKGVDHAGNKVEGSTDFLVGAALNPCSEDAEAELQNALRKIAAGAKFFQTQAVYDVDVFRDFVKQLPRDAVVLAGIVPLKSANMANFMNEKVPGVNIPEQMISELSKSSDPAVVGLNQAADIIRQVRPSCHGVHVMAVHKGFDLAQLLSLSGIND